MLEFQIYFYGRVNGAIGIIEKFSAIVIAKNYEDMVKLLYTKYEHITNVEVKNVDSSQSKEANIVNCFPC